MNKVCKKLEENGMCSIAGEKKGLATTLDGLCTCTDRFDEPKFEDEGPCEWCFLKKVENDSDWGADILGQVLSGKKEVSSNEEPSTILATSQMKSFNNQNQETNSSTIKNLDIKQLFDLIEFPIKDYRHNVCSSYTSQAYKDTEVPESLYLALKAGVLSLYFSKYNENNRQLANLCSSLFGNTCERVSYNVLLSSCKDTYYADLVRELMENERSEITKHFLYLFFEKPSDLYEYYEQIKDTEYFKELCNEVEDIMIRQ